MNDPLSRALGRPADIALAAYAPWLTITALLVLCLLQGLSLTAGVAQPPDVDQLRDLGFSQAILDGNWFGDPIYRDEWRWYPPGAHFLGAAMLSFSHIPPPSLWVRLGPWLNLLVPLLFFAMCARLIGRRAAALSSVVFVLLNGAVARPWVTGGYTAWLLAPYIALPLFFVTTWLIHRCARITRWREAPLIGSLLGLVFLIHTVPALLLSTFVGATAVVENGPRARTFLWVAVVAAVALAWSMMFLAPLIAHYRLHVINDAPGSYLDGLLLPSRLMTRAVLVNVPGCIAAFAAWRLRKSAPLDRRSATILITWIAVCVGFLTRHYACALVPSKNPMCQAFVVPVNHFHLYLSIAWACLIGHVGWYFVRTWFASRASSRMPRIALVVGGLALAAAVAWFFDRPYDRFAREQAQRGAAIFDVAAYEWVRTNSAPDAVFVTELSSPESDDPAAFSVIAAGRHLVAAPELHSNPYVDWHERDVRRRRYLSAALDASRMPDTDLCAFAHEAGNAGAWFVLPNPLPVSESIAERMFQDAYFSIYRVRTALCQ